MMMTNKMASWTLHIVITLVTDVLYIIVQCYTDKHTTVNQTSFSSVTVKEHRATDTLGMNNLLTDGMGKQYTPGISQCVMKLNVIINKINCFKIHYEHSV